MKERYTIIIYLIKNEVIRLDKQNHINAQVFDFISEEMTKPVLNKKFKNNWMTAKRIFL